MVEFGLQIEPQYGFAYDQIRDLALLCESVGFNSIWCSDHFFLDQHSEDRNCWDCWTVLAALAVETSSLRRGRPTYVDFPLWTRSEIRQAGGRPRYAQTLRDPLP